MSIQFLINVKNKSEKISLIIMAAGVSKRYGKTNKLLQNFNGKRLIDIIIDVIPKDLFESIIAVTSNTEVFKAFDKNDIECITNQDPNRGIGSTIKLGLSSISKKSDGYMFLVCDQPFLSKQTIIELINFWINNSKSICALAYADKMGNPVIFPDSLFNQLYNLSDEQSGKVVINNNKDLLKMHYIKNKREIFDIDTISDLKHANQLINKI